MLILTRRTGEKLMIGDGAMVTVLAIKGNQVRIVITAPKEVAVHREEIYERIKAEKREVMENKRSEFGKRRQYKYMPRVPFTDSMGVTINQCRRKIADRRINNIQGCPDR